MSHLLEGYPTYFKNENEAFHYLLGALASAVTFPGNTNAEKLQNVVELISDFDTLFPSPIITSTLKKGVDNE